MNPVLMPLLPHHPQSQCRRTGIPLHQVKVFDPSSTQRSFWKSLTLTLGLDTDDVPGEFDPRSDGLSLIKDNIAPPSLQSLAVIRSAPLSHTQERT